MKGAVYIPIVLIIVMGIAMGIAATYPYVQAKIVPMMVGGVIMLLAIVELAKELRSHKRSIIPEEVRQKDETGMDLRGYMVQGAWTVGFCLLIYLVGFVIGITVFIATYARAYRARWLTSIGLGIFMAVLSHILFSYLVESELYTGVILRRLGLAG